MVLLVCNTGRLNSVLSESHGHGRVVPTATDRHFWEQGIPNGTGGISSIFKDHLGAEQGWWQTDYIAGPTCLVLWNTDCLHASCRRKSGMWMQRIHPRVSYMHDNLCQLAQYIYCCHNYISGVGNHLTAQLIRQRPRFIFKVCTVDPFLLLRSDDKYWLTHR